MISDLHNHSKYSYDSTRDMEDMVKEAISKNVNYFAFTDHLDFNKNDPGCNFYKGEEQFEEFKILKKKYFKTITLFYGIESSYEKEYEEKIKKSFRSFNFDFRIVSLHFVKNIVISNWIKMIEEDKEKISDVDYTPYFKQLKDIIDFGDFEILGHIDYYKKYSKFKNHHKTFKRYENEYKDILKSIIKKNIILEINTSGLRHRCEEQFPSEEILEMYKDFGGKMVSTGSDSHREGDILTGYDLIKKILKRFNFEIFKL